MSVFKKWAGRRRSSSVLGAKGGECFKNGAVSNPPTCTLQQQRAAFTSGFYLCLYTCVFSRSLSLPPPPPPSLPFLPLFLSLPSLPYVTHLLLNDSVLIFLLSRAPGSPSLGLLSTEFKQKSLDNVDFSHLFFFTISLPYSLQKLSKKYTCPMREKGGVWLHLRGLNLLHLSLTSYNVLTPGYSGKAHMWQQMGWHLVHTDFLLMANCRAYY